MKQLPVLLIIVLSSFMSFGQKKTVNQNDSYKYFVDTLKNSKDLKYEEILSKYDDYIERNPDDIIVQVYKCKFVGGAYYDEYEDYNLKYDETIDCIDNLYSNHQKNAEVLLYKLENTYEDKEELIESILDVYEEDKSKWTYQQIGKFYEIGANYYSEENDYKAKEYAIKAEKFSDSLDLSVLLTNINLRLGNKHEAKENLMSALYKDHDAWVLSQKAKLLVELDEAGEAIKMFERVKKKDSTYSFTESLYGICLKNKDYKQARFYLIEDTITSWSKTESIQKLLNHDIKYSNAETALEVYRRMQSESFYDDFFGIKRLKLFFKAPFKSWTIFEFFHILILMLLVLLLFLVPYLWVLPVYGAGKYFKFKNIKGKVKLPVDWSLKHFWLISFGYLCCQTILILIFYYQDYMNYLFEVVYTYVDEEVVETDLEIANSLLAFTFILFIFTLFFLNKKRLKYVFSSILSFRQIIGFSILFLVANSIVLKILGQFVDLTEGANLIRALSAKKEVAALLREYGFLISVLFTAIIVPFYEEIIFRGIILSSTEKHVGFKYANVIQASLFAAVHFSLNLFVFYLFFGLITGYAVKRTNGLFTGFVFHAVNNFAVVLLLYWIARTMPQFGY